MNNALFTSQRQDLTTPEVVLERVRRLGPIMLDPCSNAHSIVKAAVEWRLERGEDGLKRSWQHMGTVWCNWPYDDGLTWLRKIKVEAQLGTEIIGLGPARTDTEWFQDYAFGATALHFWRGRLTFGVGLADVLQTDLFAANDDVVEFEPAKSGAPFPSVLPYWGTRPHAFKKAFEGTGRTVIL